MSVKAAAGIACAAAGTGCLAGMVTEGLRYSSWGDPGAMTLCVAFLGGAVALLLVPAAMLALWFGRELRREVRQLGLTPGQAALAEFVAMEVAHHVWKQHNEAWSERLTESVMGPARPGTFELRGQQGVYLIGPDGREERVG